MSRNNANIFKEFNKERKYDSFYDEYSRFFNVGFTIVTKINLSEKVWAYALDLFLASFKPKLEISALHKGLVINISKKKTLLIYEYIKNEIITIEQKGENNVIKRTSLEKRPATLFKKYSKIDYYALYKKNERIVGLQDSINKMILKRRERFIAAKVGEKIAKHFHVEPQDWIKTTIYKYNKRGGKIF